MQRTSIALALCTESRALVLDEFSDGLDPSQIVTVRNIIKQISKNKAVVFSTHHIEEALFLCDSIYIIHHGKIAAQGSANEIIKSTASKNLEDAFIRLTEK